MGSTGPDAIYKIVQERLETAYHTIATHMAMQMFLEEPIDDRDPFDIWVEQVRKEEDLINGINGS